HAPHPPVDSEPPPDPGRFTPSKQASGHAKAPPGWTRGAAERPGTGSAARSGGTGSLQLMDYPWPPPYRTRAVQQLIKGLAWGPPTSRAVWAALESPITATAAPTSTTSLPATSSALDVQSSLRYHPTQAWRQWCAVAPRRC